MRVLYIVKTNDGAAWAFNQAAWLHSHGVEIVVVLPFETGGYADRYRNAGMSVVGADLSLPIGRPWLLFERIKIARNIVNDVKPDIIHCHFVTNIMMVRLALGRDHCIPRFFQVPGPLHLESLFFRNAEIILSGQCDYWGGGCQLTCSIYKRSGIASDHIFLAYYGGYGGNSVEEYQPRSGKFRQEFGIATDVPLVGMVSYFYKPKYHLLQTRGLKGHEDFIEAFSLVLKENPHVRGIIIGGPWLNAHSYVEKIKKMALELCGDSIVFAGYRRDMKSIYRELDIAVHPSLSENLGGAAESLAAGVPTIATSVGGFPDIVQNEITGLLVKPKCPIEIAAAIKRMIEDKVSAEKMANSGQMLVKSLLDIEVTAKNVREIYGKIIASRKGE